MSVALIFQGGSLALSVAKLTGVVQDKLQVELDRLSGAEFEAGMRALAQATNAGKEQESLLREARGRFNKAISLEKELRLASAFLGLAVCHSWLGDTENAREALTEFVRCTPPRQPSTITVAGRTVTGVARQWLSGVLSPPTQAFQSAMDGERKKHEEVVRALTDSQREAEEWLKGSLQDVSQKVTAILIAKRA